MDIRSQEIVSAELKQSIFSNIKERKEQADSIETYIGTYVTHVQSLSLSPETKKDIFLRLNAKKRTGLFMQKMKKLTRVGVFCALLIGVISVFYIWTYDGNIGTWTFDDGFIWYNIDDQYAQKTVFADDIGEIIQVTGDIQISNNGQQKEATRLAHADRVILLEWSELMFMVKDGIQAKIIWPAEFEITKEGSAYTINMFDGEYVKLISVVPNTQEDKIELKNGQENEQEEKKKQEQKTPEDTTQTPQNTAPSAIPTQTDKEENKEVTTALVEIDTLENKPTISQDEMTVIVKTPTFELTSTSQWEAVDIVLTEKDGKPVVENEGESNVQIVKVIQDTRVVTQLKHHQEASINGEVTVKEIEEDLEEIDEDLRADENNNENTTTNTDTWETAEKDDTISSPSPTQPIEIVPQADIAPDEVIQEEEAADIAKKLQTWDVSVSYKIAPAEEAETKEETIVIEEEEIKDIIQQEDIQVEEPELELEVEVESELETETDEIVPPSAENTLDTQPLEEALQNIIPDWLPETGPDTQIQDDTIQNSIENNKRVISWEDLQARQRATNNSVLMRDIKNIAQFHAHGNSNSLQTSLSNLASTLSPIGYALWWMHIDATNIYSMDTSVSSLISNSEAKWYIPPTYIQVLKSIRAWLRVLQTVDTWSIEPSCGFECIVTEHLYITPDKRHFFML